MAFFKDMLRNEESLFLDTVALDYDYIPKLVPFREQQQRIMAACIKPLFQKRNGRNLFIYGQPGVGKTVACKHVLKELEDETDEIIPIYINCWQKNTSYKVVLEMCDAVGYKFTQNRKTDDLFKTVKEILNKKAAVFVLDEIDKLEEIDILYAFLEEIYNKSIFIITNYKNWLLGLDERIKSRLTAEVMEFKPYNAFETKEILKQRLKYAFREGVWEIEAFDIIAKKAVDMGDIRSGLYLMKESGNIAEESSSRKITTEHVKKAIAKFDEFSIKKKEDLEEDVQFILEIIKSNSGKKIGDIFEKYRKEGGKAAYKTFQRKIEKLEQGKFITAEKTKGGEEGNTTIINYVGYKTKKLTEF